jgi:hypothetical protein
LKKYIKFNIWRVVVRPFYIQGTQFLKINVADCTNDIANDVTVEKLGGAGFKTWFGS